MVGLSLAAVGCNDSPTRQAEKRVMKQVEDAERLRERAQSMLADVLFMVNVKKDEPGASFEEAAPLFNVVVKDENTTVTVKYASETGSTLNPKALTALTEARKALTSAVAESGAPKPALVLANESLACVRALQGTCEEYKANVLRQNIAVAVGQIQDSIPVIRAHLNVQSYIDKLVGGAKEEVAPQIEKILIEIKAESDALQVKVDAAQTEKGKQEAARAKLMGDTTRLAKELNDLGQKLTSANVPQKMELLKEIEAKEIEAKKADLRTKVAEKAIEDVTAELVLLDVRVKTAAVRQVMFKDFEKKHGESAGKHRTTRTMQTNLTVSAGNDMVKRLEKIEGDWAALAKIELAAQVCYDDAAGLLKYAQGLAGPDHGASLPSSEGQARMASARIDIATLAQRRTNAALAASVRKLWREITRLRPKSSDAKAGGEVVLNDPEEVLARLEVFPSSKKKAATARPTTATSQKADAGSVTAVSKKKAAAEEYGLAIRAFKSAVAQDAVPLSWVNRGRLAHATYMYAICANHPESLKAAQAVIRIALADKRESPNVGTLLAIEQRLTFGADTFLTVKEVVGDKMIHTDSADNGSFFRELHGGRTTKDLPGTVYMFDKETEGHKAGEVSVMISRGLYMTPPEGFELTIPADMTIRGLPYKKMTEDKVSKKKKRTTVILESGGRMPGKS